MWPLIVYGNRRQFISAITQRCASYTRQKHPIHLVRYAEVAGDLRGAAIRAIWEAMLACKVVGKASHKTVSYDHPPRHTCAPITYRSVWMNKGVDWESQCAREMEIEGDDGGFSKSRFEMRPVVSDQPGKKGRGWPLPVKEVVATNPFISDRGSFSQKDFKPSLLAAQNLAGFDPATNIFTHWFETFTHCGETHIFVRHKIIIHVSCDQCEAWFREKYWLALWYHFYTRLRKSKIRKMNTENHVRLFIVDWSLKACQITENGCSYYKQI